MGLVFRFICIGIVVVYTIIITTLFTYSNISSPTTSVENGAYTPKVINNTSSNSKSNESNDYKRKSPKPNVITFHFIELPIKEGFIELLVVKNSRGFSKIHPDPNDIAFKASININEIIADRVSINTHLEPGRYAAKFFIDLNGNKKFDTNIIGFPLEPFGFSKKIIFLTGLPDFEEVFFDIEPNESLELELDFYYL